MVDITDFVVWSGGADSTYLLYTLAKKSSKENPVNTISIEEHSYIATSKKLKSEKKSRETILKWMKDKGYHIKNHNVKFSSSLPSQTGNHPLYWVSLIPQLIPEDSCVHFGYVFDDCFWHIRDKFNNAFFALTKVKVNRTSNIELQYDLEWTHKEEVLKELKKIKLLDLIWTCEYPKKVGKPCGKCDTCIKQKEILKKIK